MTNPRLPRRSEWERLHLMETEMDEQAFCDQLASNVLEEHFKATGVQGTLRDALAKVFSRLRASGVNWPAILAKVGQIVAVVIANQGNWVAIITEVLKLFGLLPTAADLA